MCQIVINIKEGEHVERCQILCIIDTIIEKYNVNTPFELVENCKGGLEELKLETIEKLHKMGASALYDGACPHVRILRQFRLAETYKKYTRDKNYFFDDEDNLYFFKHGMVKEEIILRTALRRLNEI